MSGQTGDRPVKGPPRPPAAEWTQGIKLGPGHALAGLLGDARWCCWRWVRTGKGKWTKKPELPAKAGPGWGLSVNKAAQHGRAYEVCRDAVTRGDEDGVGWLLQGEMGLVWLDLDKCRAANGDMDPWAQALIARCGQCYIEITPSGLGLRIVGKAGELAGPAQGVFHVKRFLAGASEAELAAWGGSRACDDRAQVEVFFGCARFVTVTGADLGGSLDAELGKVAAELLALAGSQGGGGGGVRTGGGDPQADIEDIASALGVIPNGDGWDEGKGWEEWNTIGMAAWAASGGSAAGFEAWAAWSARCEDKHDAGECEARWTHWHASPPTRLGIGKLAILAKAATGGSWRRPSRRPERDFGKGEGREEGSELEEGEGDGGGVSGASGTRGAGGDGGGVDSELTPFLRLAARVVYVKALNRFFDVVDRTLMDEARLIIEAGKMKVAGFAVRGKKGVVAQLVGHPAGVLRHAVGLTMRPGQGLLVEEEEGVCVNLWRPSGLVPSDGDASVWLEHVDRLIPNAVERGRTLDRFAFLLQRQGVKVNNALVLLGPQGAGKDMMLDPVWAALGGHNKEVVKGHRVGEEFDEYLQKAHLLISEMPSYRKRSCYEEIKGWLTTPPDMIRVNPKGTPAFQVRNLINVVVTTNHFDAIALAEDDRRFDVVTTVSAGGAGVSEAEIAATGAYFQRLHDWLAAGGREAVMGWLLKRDVSGFNPKQRPPVSAGKAVMIREAEPAAMAWARSLWGPDGPLHGRVLVTLVEVMELARRGVWGAGDMARGHHLINQINRALVADGWQNTKVQVLEADARPRVWARGAPELYAQMEPRVLRGKLEEDRKRNAGNEF